MTTFIEMLTIQWTPRETWIGDLTISIHLVIQHTEKAKKSSQSGSFVTQKPRGSAGFILSCHNAGIQTNSLSSVDSKHTVNHFTLTQGIFLDTFQVGS